MDNNRIIVRGAREHNLKNIDVEIPRNKLVVITGLSGSGKSSLAFDTIYAEGQRRYVESLSAYARQFLGLMEKPDVDQIEGLSPAISIEQRSSGRNPRSTVATVTEIYDYLRLMYANIGEPHCHQCGVRVEKQSPQEIVEEILKMEAEARVIVLAPVVRGRKGEYHDLFRQIQRDGYVRVRVDGDIYPLDEVPVLKKNIKHHIDVVVDRLVLRSGVRSRLTDSVETALDLGSGIINIRVGEAEKMYSRDLVCRKCGISYEEIAPRTFSFNSPYGACEACSGIGTRLELDPNLVVPDETISLGEGAVEPIRGTMDTLMTRMLGQMADHFKINMSTPFAKLSDKQRQMVLYGSGKRKFHYDLRRSDGTGRWQGQTEWEGVIPNLERRYRQTASDGVRRWIEKYMTMSDCEECGGSRLNPVARSVLLKGVSIHELTHRSIGAAWRFINDLQLTPAEEHIIHQVRKEVLARLKFLVDVGVDYLTLDRTAGTLSGGEAQRIRLATQIGSQLVGVLYILDEPSIGLHQRDNDRLIRTLQSLRDIDNTVIVVEHDRETMEEADYLIDLGPGAGLHGGEVVAAGTPAQIRRNARSITGRFLAGTEIIEVPVNRRTGIGQELVLTGATGNNLKEVTLRVPLGKVVCVTGVSGSGKSTLINETLYRVLANRLNHARKRHQPFQKLTGLEFVDKVIDIDQSPIGRTPRSNPATYTGMFTPIRDLFAMLPESKMRGYKPGRFSFNVRGGRCDACDGDGIRKIEMHFLPDVYVRCEVCKGRRYNQETLEVRYKGKSIAEVLEMTVDEALSFFQNLPQIARRLQTLHDVGLGYVHLGQQATTLSGGEAQRIKLATELSRAHTGRTVYILDEPTTGLHFADIRMLLDVLNRLVDKGNTVIIIEHNLDVIKTADHIIDLGPEGGEAGGEIIASGTPEEVAGSPHSHTGHYLREELKIS